LTNGARGRGWRRCPVAGDVDSDRLFLKSRNVGRRGNFVCPNIQIGILRLFTLAKHCTLQRPILSSEKKRCQPLAPAGRTPGRVRQLSDIQAIRGFVEQTPKQKERQIKSDLPLIYLIAGKARRNTMGRFVTLCLLYAPREPRSRSLRGCRKFLRCPIPECSKIEQHEQHFFVL